MRVLLDLFAGTGSFSEAFQEAENWHVTTVDIEEEIEYDDGVAEPDVVADVIDIDIKTLREALPASPDVVLASPVCKPFTMAAVGHHFTDNYVPTSHVAYDSIAMAEKALTIIREFNPVFWVMENPRMMLRKFLHLCPQCGHHRVFNPAERYEHWCTECHAKFVNYAEYNEQTGTQTALSWCQYADGENPAMKPTDFFGKVPAAFEYRMCENGAGCHESAQRGAKTGTQGKDGAANRAAIPYGLSRELYEAVETEFARARESTTDSSPQTVIDVEQTTSLEQFT